MFTCVIGLIFVFSNKNKIISDRNPGVAELLQRLFGVSGWTSPVIKCYLAIWDTREQIPSIFLEWIRIDNKNYGS